MSRFHDRRLRWAIAVLILLAVPASALVAQTAGARLEGIVKDQSQAVIPGVTVTAVNENTGISYTSLTNDTGLYVFVTLPPGTYTLTCELQGFKRYVNKGLTLTVGATATVNIVLETGEISTEVVVSAAAPLIDVTSGKIGAVVQEQQIVDLPINGRNPMMFYYLQAGTNPLDSLGGQQAVGSVDGLRTNANNVRVDGVWAADASYDMSPAAPNVAVPLEAVGEYRVTTSSATADSGRGAGAQVSVVYKSGTNEFHGNVYEFNRNTSYNAGEFFANKSGQGKPKFIRNQYGASLGGPIIKNKTFFFGTWEGQREISGRVMNFLTYTAPVRQGIFRYNTTGTNNKTTMVNPQTGEPLVPFSTIDLYTIDPTRLGPDLSGKVERVFKEMPLPNNYDIGDGFNLGGYRFLGNEPNHYNQFVAKIDHALSAKHQLSVSFGGFWRHNESSFFPNGYAGQIYDERKRNIFIGIVSALTPTLTNEWRAGATQRKTVGGPENPANFDPKGVFQLSGLGSARAGSNYIGVYLPQRNPIDAFNINDNVSWVVKNHTIKFGFEVTHTTKNNWFGGDNYIPTVYTSTTYNPATVPSMAGLNSTDRTRAQQLVNDVTGTIGHIVQIYNANSLALGFVPYDTRHRLLNQREWGVFFQDTWKIRQNLTINFGTRWDLLPPGYMKNGVYTYPKQGSASVFGVSGPAGIYETGLAPNKGKDIIEWDWNNFGPNLGLTWDPFKDGKMSVSANFRVAYDRQMQSVYSRLEDQNMGMNVQLTAVPKIRFSDPTLYTVWGDSKGIRLPVGKPFEPIPFVRQGRAYALAETIRTPYTESWSLRIQRELMKDWYLQAAYVGNTSVGGWRAINYNQIEIRKNGFLQGFLAAQRNLAASGDPLVGEPTGTFGQIFSKLSSSARSGQKTNITNGVVATVADYLDTYAPTGGQRGDLVTQAGLPNTFFRINPQVQNATICDNLSVSTYHAMKLELGKRFSGGTYLQFNYTLGKSLTDYVGGQGQYNDYRDNENRRLDKSFQDYDSTHIIQANWLWQLPFGEGKRWLNSGPGFMDYLFGGWSLNGIFSLATSRPFTITSNRNMLTLGDTSTADYSGKDFNIASKVIKGGDGVIRALTAEEVKLFSFPPPGSPGGTPQRAFRGPIYSNWDASLLKNFKAAFLGEQGYVQFRAEAFNVLNHPNFTTPNGTLTSGNFGQISGNRSARILQFALKVNF